MKHFNYFFFLALFISLSSCTNDGDNNEATPSPTPSPQPQITYAMTAKINGAAYQMNNVFGTNTSTTTVWDYYPSSEFIRLQGSIGGLNGGKEINIWIKRTDLVPGTYPIGIETEDGTKSYIDLIDLTNEEFEDTYTGSITINAVNTTTKTVKGTFNFKTSANPNADSPVENFTITGGTFNYRYDVQ